MMNRLLKDFRGEAERAIRVSWLGNAAIGGAWFEHGERSYMKNDGKTDGQTVRWNISFPELWRHAILHKEIISAAQAALAAEGKLAAALSAAAGNDQAT